MTFGQITELFKYPFVTRAVLAGVLVALCAALLGVVLVLKRYSLIGHGLADVGFASVSIALALGFSPMLVSMPLVIIASFIIMTYSQKKGIEGDVVLGILTTASISAGVIITAVTNGFNIDVYNYMFGSILAMQDGDIIISAALAVVVISMFVLFYNKIFLITSDENFAAASGINVMLYQFMISFLTALTVVIGMRMMGTLLISSLIILPSVTAGKISRSFKSLVVLSSIISAVCFIMGIIVSFVFNLPTGASVVAVNVLMLIIVSGFSGVLRKR